MGSRNRPFKFPVSILIGSTPVAIFKVIKGYRIDLRYYLKFVLTIIVSLIFAIFGLVEYLIFKKKVKAYRHEEAPVFIIGFWRSGTTLLHSLLCQDPQAGYVNTFHGVFPNLVLTQKKWLKALINSILPKKRPFDGYSLDMDLPQEEDFALLSLQGKSIYKFFYFPKDFNKMYEKELYFDQYTAKQQQLWKKEYQTFTNKAMLNTGGKRYISKNPCNIFRVKVLTELFPEAKFIFIYRNPYTVVESFYRFANEVLPGSELQHIEGGIPREGFARLYKDSIHEYNRVKESIKPANLIEIKYEDFKNRPLERIREIYEQFNIPGIEEALPLMDSYLNNNHPDGRKPYETDPEIYHLVNEYAGDIVKRLGYPTIESPK
jgi:hypothetical protein